LKIEKNNIESIKFKSEKKLEELNDLLFKNNIELNQNQDQIDGLKNFLNEKETIMNKLEKNIKEFQEENTQLI